MELTIFNSVYDNKTHRRMKFDSWESFVDLLEKLSGQPGYKPKKGERPKFASPLISPAIFDPGATRSNASVSHWAGWAALDIDDWTPEGLEHLNENLRHITHVRYSTSSSTEYKPKFRLVFRLDSYVERDSIRAVWYALNKEFSELGDPQTKDLSRMFYVPAVYPNAYNFFDRHDLGSQGAIIVSELLRRHPLPVHYSRNSFMDKLPEHIQKKMTEYKKTKLNNTNIRWTSFRDCPFVNSDLVTEYATAQSNWYHKMYKILVSIASRAISRGYPITPDEISALARQIDDSTGGWYKNRPLELEAARAIEFSLRTV
jgi:hypothetical protein